MPPPYWSLDGVLAESSGIAVRAISARLEEGGHGVLLYLVTAPDDLAGWTIAARQATVLDGQGKAIPVLRAASLASVGRVSLAAVSFPLGEASAGPISFRFDGLVASRDGVHPQQVEGTWLISPVERREVESIPNSTVTMLVIGLLSGDDCLETGGVTITFWSTKKCPGFEQWETMPTATPALPLRPGTTATPIPRPPAPWVQVFTFKFYAPHVTLVDVGVTRDGGFGVVD